MNRFNAVPVSVQQIVESVESKSTPEHVRFNQVQVLETIRDCCDKAIAGWKKEQERPLFKKRK